MNREVGKARVPALNDVPVDKCGAEGAIAILSGDIITAKLSGFDVPDQ